MKDFDTFTKIPSECERFGQINCRQKLLKVAQSTKNRPIWSHCPENTHHNGKDYCTAGLQYNKIGCDQKENIWLLVCTSVAVESIIVKLESGDQQSYSVLNEN